jgi:hypothetical protein
MIGQVYLQGAVVADEALLPDFISLLTLAQVVPTISAKVDWLTFRGDSAFDSLLICQTATEPEGVAFRRN